MMGARYKYKKENIEDFRGQLEKDLFRLEDTSLSKAVKDWEVFLFDDKFKNRIIIEDDGLRDCSIIISRGGKGVICPGCNGPRIEGVVRPSNFCYYRITLFPVVGLRKGGGGESSHKLYNPNGEYVFELAQKFEDKRNAGFEELFYYGDILPFQGEIRKFERDIKRTIEKRLYSLDSFRISL